MRTNESFGSGDGPGPVDDLPLREAEPVRDERVEAELLASAHREAITAGTEWFAAELQRRDDAEHLAEVVELRTRGVPKGTQADGPPTQPRALGPVEATVVGYVIEPERADLDLRQPMRHPSVPRPPAPDAQPEPEPHRRRRRRTRDQKPPERTPVITPQQAARMSNAGRRLYGLPELPDPRRR